MSNLEDTYLQEFYHFQHKQGSRNMPLKFLSPSLSLWIPKYDNDGIST